ncbi:hypothetical protein [Congregicoccus parvus]|uniref:hypothetical protein n=1 Tax=Congregicoccus parvus TaxID=3081749 RepID=UPI003FA562C9
MSDAPPDLRFAYHHVVPAGPEWWEAPPPEVAAARWVVVDDYGVDDSQLRRLARALGGGKLVARPGLLVLDDEGRRRLDAADLILNSRLGLERSPYAADASALLGARFALLRPGLRTPDPVSPPFPQDAEGVLVMLGGTDPRGLTPHVLEGLADVGAERFCPVVVRTQQAPEADAIRRALDRFPGSAWLEGLGASSLAGWARACRFAVSAAGGTLYELAHFHLPFVAIVVAENQRALAAEVGMRWSMPVVDVDGGVREAVAAAFRALVEADPATLRSALSAVHVDGRGAGRVVDAMERRAPETIS